MLTQNAHGIVKQREPFALGADAGRLERVVPLDVLLVDDDALAREQLSRLLAHESIHVRACADAAEALRWLRRERYDLVATDWRLGHAPSALDGPKLSRIIR